MATADERALPAGAVTDFIDRYGLDWVHLAVGNVVLVSLLAHLYDLGSRVAHWDEARVAYWTVRYIETGNFQYRPIIHGPFFHHVNRVIFQTFGMSDFTMRVAIAVLGALLPLSTLLLRERLRDVEVVALALFLTINPVILYYTRFMRGDPVVAVFMFAGFACFVRAIDTGRRRWVLAGTAMVALGFTGKENALLYVVTWIGATVLLLDHRLFRAADRDQNWVSILITYLWTAGGLLKRYLLVLFAAALEFLAIIVFFYAPRSPTKSGVGFNEALRDPSKFPELIRTATIGSWTEFYGLWVNGSHQDHPYLPFLTDYLDTFAAGALALGLLAVLGFLADRYSEEGPRDVVSFAFYWGFVSILGYPLVTDIKAPWATMHAVVPLAIPAAVGFGLFVRWGRSALSDEDYLGTGIAVLAIVLVVGQIAVAAGGAVYVNHSSRDNSLIQYAQPADNIHPVVDRLEAATATESGTNVVMYSDFFIDGGKASVPRKPGCVKWFNALPLPWYFETTDANVSCATNENVLKKKVATQQPALVISRKSDRRVVSQHAENYTAVTHRLRAWGTETTFFVHEDYATGLGESENNRVQ